MRRSQRLRPDTREIGRRIVIACEGEKTEPGYFHAIRQDLHLSRQRVTILPRSGTDPLSIVNSLIAERDRQRKDGRWATGDTAWAVFDGEEHMLDAPTNWDNALRNARRDKRDPILLAVSNPCIEFWYLLHFEERSAYLSRDRVWELLKKYVPKYEKGMVLYPEPLKALTPIALQRAKSLASPFQSNKTSPYPNPCTHVADLVASLLSLHTETR